MTPASVGVTGASDKPYAFSTSAAIGPRGYTAEIDSALGRSGRHVNEEVVDGNVRGADEQFGELRHRLFELVAGTEPLVRLRPSPSAQRW
jgi:hypothetical protein